MKQSLLFALLFLAGHFCTSLNAQPVTFTGQELLGRPTQSSVTINAVANQPLDAYIQYGTQTGVYTGQTNIVSLAANEPIEIVVTSLQSNTKYYYQLVYRKTGTSTWMQRAEHFFYTQRQPGSTFKFDVTSDSHVNILLGNGTTWQRTLTNIDNDDPDFLIDCGDTFAMDNITSQSGADNSYIFQRSATTFGLVSASVPVFLAVGNHEEQEGWHLDDNGNPVNSQPVWGTNAQKKYFLNPVPDGFYSGNSDTYYALNGDQRREDYYAWTWGNALFVVVDPYWYTMEKPFIGNTGGGEPGGSDGDRWHWTLGDVQYNWLKQTLQNSNAMYKFLFMHHMTGGTDDYIRGGAYAAKYCEWGGYNEDGSTYAFNTRRPGWNMTIHQMLVSNHVSAVFHGHDHQYAYEKLDGVVYQSLPAAGFSGNGFGIYNETDPLTLKTLQSGGHLRVSVSPTGSTVEYISSNTTTNGQMMYSYIILPVQNGPLPVQLASFIAQSENNKKVLLKWETVAEFQNKQFVVQRANAAGDFKNIGIVAATNSPSGSVYNFVDEPGLGGTYLYRIIQEDLDGKQTHSLVRSVTLNKKYIQVVDKGTSWQLQTAHLVNYSLLDMQGRLIEKGTFSGTKIITKPSTGSMYVLRSDGDGEMNIQKLLK